MIHDLSLDFTILFRTFFFFKLVLFVVKISFIKTILESSNNKKKTKNFMMTNLVSDSILSFDPAPDRRPPHWGLVQYRPNWKKIKLIKVQKLSFLIIIKLKFNAKIKQNLI